MNVLVAGVVKQIDTVIIDDYVQDDEGNALSVLAKRIVLDNNQAYFTTGNIDVEIGQDVCFYINEGQDKIIKSIKKDEVESLNNKFMAKQNCEAKSWKAGTLYSLVFVLISALFVNDSLHGYLASNDPVIHSFFFMFCFFLFIATLMSGLCFSLWRKHKKKSFLSSEDKETLERFKSGLLKEGETQAVNMKVKEAHHV